MEGCWTMTISSDLASAFPTLLRLSAEEAGLEPDTSFLSFADIVSIWDAVSDYILEQLKLDKGVLVERLGVFVVLKEQFHGKGHSISVRRPVFQLDISAVGPQHVSFHREIIPDGVEIEPLNYRRLSQATAFSLIEVQHCVQETIHMFHLLLRNKEHVSFAFKNIGILTYEDEFLCTRFYFSCITALGNEAHLIVLLQTVS
ncbi:UNVERIFIED_CONTAM: hypothetical protein H355_012517 [Colinus virginianus]|nr:hypothetical protein H355_012517 [Colinus virginianus]